MFKFPFGTMNELNLDWIITKVRELIDTAGTTKEKITFETSGGDVQFDGSEAVTIDVHGVDTSGKLDKYTGGTNTLYATLGQNQANIPLPLPADYGGTGCTSLSDLEVAMGLPNSYVARDTTAGLAAYGHDGSNERTIPVEITPNPAGIPYRDVNGNVRTNTPDNDKDAANKEYVDAQSRRIDALANSVVYGFHIDSSISDPANAVTYLADANGMTPAKMNFSTGVFDYGSWADVFFLPRPCMLKYDGTVDYYLDPDDYTKKVDGSASDVADTSYGGNAMMEWGRDGQKIWYKVIPDESDNTSVSVYIANYRLDENYHAWSFINNQGKYVDHFYTPIYIGHSDGTRMRSLSGQQYTQGQTAAQERTLCRANGSDLWDTEVFCDVILINYLLVLMGKSLDSQTVFGEGLHTDGTEAINNGFRTGVHNTKGLFYGTSSGAAATYGNAVKVFGMENWWGFVWRRFGGLVNAKGTAKYKLTRGTQDGSSATDYVVSETEGDYSGYLTGASIPASISGTIINTQTYKADGSYFPTAASGSATTYYCDGLWTNNTQVDYALRGGASNASFLVGAFCLALNTLASAANWYRTAAPSCKPRY